MPELPEVETTLRGIRPFVEKQTIKQIVVRDTRLRWPVPEQALQQLLGESVNKLQRRAKYLLLNTRQGTILFHLGMSGSMRIVSPEMAVAKHDHIDIVFANNKGLRLNDPRRFGCCLLLNPPVEQHKLLLDLGPEPLSDDFNGDYLFAQSRGRKLAVKNFIMHNRVVVGVGNIYASEALFLAGVRPTIAASRISNARFNALAKSIKQVLEKAIQAGGTTLNDFTQADGKPGYFQQQLNVYGRDGLGCVICQSQIKSKVIGQRNTFYCPQCQT